MDRTYSGVSNRLSSGSSYACERLNGGIGHFNVLCARPPAHADASDDLTFDDQRDASAQYGKLPMVGCVDPIRRTAGKRRLREVGRRHLHSYARPCLALGNLDSGDPGIVHAVEGDQVRAFINDREIEGEPHLSGFLFRDLKQSFSCFQCKVDQLIHSLDFNAPL
jgi:hypothetical protein